MRQVDNGNKYFPFSQVTLIFTLVGNVYIADYSNNRIRKVTVSTGIITTFAGTGVNSYSGDGGAATSAELDGPTGVVLDSSGTYLLSSLHSQYYFLLISREPLHK
jgi:hypothetical protein